MMDSNKEAIGNVDSQAFSEARDANNMIEKKVAHMRESVLDAKNLHTLAVYTTKQAHNVAVVTQAVTVEAVIQQLRKKFAKDEDGDDEDDDEAVAGGEFDWEELGTKVAHLFGSVAATDFLCGPVGKVPVARKERKKKGEGEDVAEEEGGVTKHSDVQQGDAKEAKKEQTQVRIAGQFDLLKKSVGSSSSSSSRSRSSRGGDDEDEDDEDDEEKGEKKEVDFFNFLVDPTSFTQTVENVFDLSFLVKQGKAALRLDGRGLPVLTTATEDQCQGDDDQKSTQLVMALSPKDIREAIEAFNCRGDGVPHRKDQSYDDKL